MDALIKRVVNIMALMYYHEAEIVVSNLGCHLFLGSKKKDILLQHDEVDCLIDNEIVILDSGYAERENERFNYILTKDSHERIEKILADNKILTLK